MISGQGAPAYEFGVKVSVATKLRRSKGRQFITNVRASPGNPFECHTLSEDLPCIKAQFGANLSHIVADMGYRGQNAPPDQKLKVYISSRKRGVIEAINRELTRRSAVEPSIHHLKFEHRLWRNIRPIPQPTQPTQFSLRLAITSPDCWPGLQSLGPPARRHRARPNLTKSRPQRLNRALHGRKIRPEVFSRGRLVLPWTIPER